MFLKKVINFCRVEPIQLFVFFLLFFVYLIYFYPMISSDAEIWRGREIFPVLKPVGVDFKIFYSYAADLWRLNMVNLTSIYPPFSTLMVMPYVVFTKVNAYRVHSFLIYFCFYTNLILASKIFISNNKPKRFFGAEFFFIIGVIGYPFTFALERGNSDVFACFFCLLYLLEFKKGNYLKAIFFLILGTQLKIYPLFLAFMLIKNHTRKYFYLFVILNFLLLFSLGMVGFKTLVSNLFLWSKDPVIWIGNHSAHSFSTILSSWLEERVKIIIDYKILMNIILVPFFGAWLWSLLTYIKETNDKIMLYRFCLNTFLLMCVITGVSHDYKLVILYPLIYVLLSWILTKFDKIDPRGIIMFIIVGSYIYYLNLSYIYFHSKIFANKFSTLCFILVTGNVILFYLKLNDNKVSRLRESVEVGKA